MQRVKRMSLISGKIARLEYEVKGLLDDLDEIKKAVRLIEQENEQLRKELALKLPGNETAKNPHDDSSLLRLYDEGFHICNIKFAKKREKECLFCASLLMRLKNSDDQKGEV